MNVETSFDTEIGELDFAALLEASLQESLISRGDTVTGTILAVDSQGLIVDVNWKRDGIVMRRDLEMMNTTPAAYEVGREIDVTVLRLEDAEGNLLLSASQARQAEDWKHAEALMESDEVWQGEIADANKGGLIVPFGHLRGFVPASHVSGLPRGLNEDDRRVHLSRMVGDSIGVKVIEVNRKRRRLVFSQRDAEREGREAHKERLLEQLSEGDVCKGVVSGLRDFGAFVDLGGADGLIHISELAWHRVNHPGEVVNVGDKVDVYVLRLDDEGKRIGLSLKRLQPNPWAMVDDLYHVGQLVEGTISRVADFGAFVSLDPGIEALLHVSQLSDEENVDPRQMLYVGQSLLMRIISIEAERQRLGLSLKEVTAAENDRWEANQDDAAEAEAAEELAEAGEVTAEAAEELAEASEVTAD